MHEESSWLCKTVCLLLHIFPSHCEPPKNGSLKEENLPGLWRLPKSSLFLHVSLSKLQQSCHTCEENFKVYIFYANEPDVNVFPTVEAYGGLGVQDHILSICNFLYSYSYKDIIWFTTVTIALRKNKKLSWPENGIKHTSFFPAKIN